MSDRSTVLLEHHLKELKLPTVKGGGILGHGAEQQCTTWASAFSMNVTQRRVSAGALSGSEVGGV